MSGLASEAPIQAMQTSVSLVRLRPDVPALTRWAMRRGYLEQPCTDLGYAVHAASRAVFGDAALRPFVLRGRGDNSELLGYMPINADSFDAYEQTIERNASERTAAQVLQVHSAKVKTMPGKWRVGQRLGFEVRIRPVVRSRLGRFGGIREIDVTSWAARRGMEGCYDKNALYLQWLDSRIRLCGAEMTSARVMGRSQTVVLRRPIKQGKRTLALCNGPDLNVQGILQVQDEQLFTQGLLRGVGRHTAFGFGCLLLAPVDKLV